MYFITSGTAAKRTALHQGAGTLALLDIHLLGTLTPAPSPATRVYDNESLSQGRRAAPVRELMYAVSDLPAGIRTPPSREPTNERPGASPTLGGVFFAHYTIRCQAKEGVPQGRVERRHTEAMLGRYGTCSEVGGCRGRAVPWASHIPRAAGLWRRCSSAAH